MSVAFNKCNGAERDRIVTELGHRDAIMIAAAGHGVQTNDLLNDGEDEIATGFEDTAAEYDQIGVEQMADVEAGVAEGFGGFAHDFSDQFVFLLEGAFKDTTFDDGEVVAGQFGDGAFATVFKGVADVALDGSAAGEGFETAAVAAPTEGAAGLHDHVADFAGGIAAAGDELAVDDEAGADAGTDKDADGGGRAAGGAAPSFTEGAEIDIVADIDRDFEAFAEEGGDDHAREGHVWGKHNFAFGRRDGTGNGEADAGEFARINTAFGEQDRDNIGDGGDDMIALRIAGRGHALAGDDGTIGVGEGGHDLGAADVNTEIQLRH